MKSCILLALFLLVPNIALAQEELSSFETTYGDYGRYRGRAHNIRLGASSIAEIVLEPGEQFSFNETVGERTRARGFRTAPVIITGRMEDGLGGGVCQIASTVYAAALYAGLTIVEHHPHSRTSGYIRAGLDATVDWGVKDLVVQNPFDFPVTINAEILPGRNEGEGVLRISITAPRRSHEVEVRISRRTFGDFDTIEELDPELPPGATRVDEPGTPRAWARVRRSFVSLDGSADIPDDSREVSYDSSDRRIRVGPSEE